MSSVGAVAQNEKNPENVSTVIHLNITTIYQESYQDRLIPDKLFLRLIMLKGSACVVHTEPLIDKSGAPLFLSKLTRHKPQQIMDTF